MAKKKKKVKKKTEPKASKRANKAAHEDSTEAQARGSLNLCRDAPAWDSEQVSRLKVDLGYAVLSIRKDLDLTQGQVAERMGKTVAWLRKIESGENMPPVTLLLALVNAARESGLASWDLNQIFLTFLEASAEDRNPFSVLDRSLHDARVALLQLNDMIASVPEAAAGFDDWIRKNCGPVNDLDSE